MLSVGSGMILVNPLYHTRRVTAMAQIHYIVEGGRRVLLSSICDM